MKKFMSNKVSSSVGIILSAFIFILSSCHKDKYSPIPANTQQRGILISFSGENNKNPLESDEFVAGISAFGNESQMQLPCKVMKINGKLYLSLIADLPDEKNMKYSGDQRQATAMTEITLKVNKQKTNLKCFFQYRDDSKPPMPTASKTSIVLESITLDRKTIKRNSKTVIDGNLVFPLQIDQKGKLH